MKNWPAPLLIVILAGLVMFNLPYFSRADSKMVSPLTDRGKLGLNQWFPQNPSAGSGLRVLGSMTDAPEITAKAAFFINTNTGQILYSKNQHDKLPIASLAKVMAVLVALENKGLDEKLLVSQRATEMEPDEMILLPGEKLTLKELLYGTFLLSANDAAEVLAETTAEGRDEFIRLMNSRAELLGMKNTKFINPTGLDEDSGNSYSSAYDLVVLARYAIKHYPVLVDISKTEHIYLERTDEHQDYDMYSGINLLTTYPGVVGFKTGYTPEAGLTLITLARKDGREVLGVLLGTENRRDEARKLLDYGFKQLGI